MVLATAMDGAVSEYPVDCGCGECSMFEMFWMRKESLFF